ncbi:putative NmrA-like family domain-containing protein 1 [Leptodontidium sp. MPI-SDFR-AT-0119]|nr:putative NmrA-like family domain-containing protein 1 [Leptodontidium sp. MPI-SDFR-AT-0119]
MSQPILTVIGATGAQGSSVVDAVLAAGIYHVRAITRNTTSDKAASLRFRGAEVVSADLNDESSLIAAFAGSSAIYAVTDFFEPFAKAGPEEGMKVEVLQGKNLANSATKTPTLKHYIWSTLPNGFEISGGKYLVPHFEAKCKIDAYIETIRDLYAKTTFLWITWYATNYAFSMFTPIFVPTSGKCLQIGTGPATTPILSIGDAKSNVGLFTNAILVQPELTYTRYILAYMGETTMGEMFKTWGRKWHMCREMGVMMELWGEYGNKSWTGQEVLTTKDLGLTSGFVGIEEAFRKQGLSGLGL